MLMIKLWVILGIEPSRLVSQHLQFSRSRPVDGLIVIRLRAVASALIVIQLRAVASTLIVVRLRVVASALIVIRLRAVASALIVIRLRVVASALIMIRLRAVASALIVIRLHVVASALIVIWLRTVASALIVIRPHIVASSLIVIRIRVVASALIVIRLRAVASALIVIRLRAMASALFSELSHMCCEEGVRYRGMTKATRHSSDTSPELFEDSYFLVWGSRHCNNPIGFGGVTEDGIGACVFGETRACVLCGSTRTIVAGTVRFDNLDSRIFVSHHFIESLSVRTSIARPQSFV
ncbi:hypothetical protein OROHE_007555 [Orobanche hederae]